MCIINRKRNSIKISEILGILSQINWRMIWAERRTRKGKAINAFDWETKENEDLADLDIDVTQILKYTLEVFNKSVFITVSAS
jgi:hypothetical protein